MGVVAAIQSPPVYADGLATARKAAESIAEAAENGAWLAVSLRCLRSLRKTDEVINPGGSMIVNPKGEIVAGPAYAQEVILYADADPAESLVAKRTFDVVGHYGRGDLFGLTVRDVQIRLQIDGKVLPAFDDHVWHVAASEPAQELKVSADPASDSP